MKIQVAALASTRLDRHGDQLPLEALEQLADSANTSYIPINVEHDPRCPPLGRIREAHVQSTEDGNHEVIGTFELFEGERPPLDRNSARKLVLPDLSASRTLLSWDRSYRREEEQVALHELAKALNASLAFEVKKALEPISVLKIVIGTFIAGEVCRGFLGKLGEDAYEAAKKHLKRIFSSDIDGHEERLLKVQLAIQRLDTSLQVDLIVTNPSDIDIDRLFAAHLDRLDRYTASYLGVEPHLAKLVFLLEEGEVTLSFGVRDDAAPFTPQELKRAKLEATTGHCRRSKRHRSGKKRDGQRRE